MKKALLVFCVLLLSIGALFAGDFRFVLADIGQHTEILGGFIPSYWIVGGGYKGLTLIEGNTTDINLLVGAGYNQRKTWQDLDTGAPLFENPLVYDVIQTDLFLRFHQGFLTSPVPDKDLFTITLAYELKYEIAKDSLKVGEVRQNGGQFELLPIDQWMGDHGGYNPDIYPDLAGDKNLMANAFAFTLKLDMMEDTMHTSDGFVAKLDAKYSPLALNQAMDGFGDYYSIGLNAVGSYTLFSWAEQGKPIFSIVAIDRVNANWTDGKHVPVYAQGSVSLGRKVRGFNTYTYNSQLTFVNNFDLRFAGPDMGVSGIFPRVNLFFDAGYGMGKYFNTSIDASNFLMSTGIQLTVCFFDFIDLGYQIAYLFDGSNYQAGQDAKVVGSFTFFLDF